jgi:hypothetical protein
MTVNDPKKALNEIDEGEQDRVFLKLVEELSEYFGKAS